jgi:hypothetical protein
MARRKKSAVMTLAETEERFIVTSPVGSTPATLQLWFKVP